MIVKTALSLVTAKNYKNVWIKAGNGLATLVSTNGRAFLTAFVPADGDGEAMLDRLILSAIGRVLSPAATLSVTGRTITIDDGVTYTLVGTPMTDTFPEPPAAEALIVTLPHDLIQRAIKQVSYCAASDEGKPVLTCVRMDSNAFAAVDGFRLSILKHNLTVETPINIPVWVLKLLPKLGPETHVNSNGISLYFFGENGAIITRAVDMPYPNYEKLTPHHTQAVTLKTRDLRSIVRKVTPLAVKGSGILRLRHQPQTLNIKTITELGEAESTLDTECSETWHIAVNAQYLGNLLASWPYPEVRLSISSEQAPLLFQTADKQLTSVIMPMFINWEDTDAS